MPNMLKFPTVASAGTDWSTPNNILIEDGNNAQAYIDPINKGSTSQIIGSNYGIIIPSTAAITGILLEVKFFGSSLQGESATVYTSTKAGSFKNTAYTAGALTWFSFGGDGDLWGRTDWTAADFNNSTFSGAISFNGIGSSSYAYVDAMRITVFYATAPAAVQTREYYKVYNQSKNYLGLLPHPTEPLKIAQDVNSLGSQITIKVPVSADVSQASTTPYTTEDQANSYTDEAGVSIYSSGGDIPIISAAFQGIDTLIKNGNYVECWLVNYWYPNGKRMFVGKIRRFEADFGGDGDAVDVVLYSTGYDMDNYITRGAPFTYTNDIAQNAYNATYNLTYSSSGGWNLYGQTWIPSAGVTNLGAIAMGFNAGSANVTVNVYTSPGGTLLGSASQYVSVGGPTGITFAFPSLIPVTPGTSYFYGVTVQSGQSIGLLYQNTNVYSNGQAYSSVYSGGSGGGAWTPITGVDLNFNTYSGTPSTTATFSSKDPSTGMLAPIITDYNLRGGSQTWNATSIDATGLSLTYKFSVQTIYEALQAILSLSPNGFYYYLDLGTQTIYFKNQSTTADFLLQKGKHINKLKLIFTTENSINTVLFTGGEVSAGVNLYKQYVNNVSISALGPLLERKSDTRVTLDATANAIGVSEIAELSGEQFQTTIFVPHTTYLDITLLVPGKVVATRGYGSFVDTLLMQIVHREWQAEGVMLTVGVLPKRLSYEYEQTTRQLIAQQTQDNPSTPS